MPGFSVVGAGKRIGNASKTISTWKYWNSKTWPLACVGGPVVGRRRTSLQGFRHGRVYDSDGGPARACRDPSTSQRRHRWRAAHSLHVRAVCKRWVPSALPPHVEDLNSIYLRAHGKVASVA